MFNVNIGCIIPILNKEHQSICFVSTDANSFAYPKIPISDNNEDSIKEYVRDLADIIDTRWLRPIIFGLDQIENEINILYAIVLYPDTLVKDHYLIPHKKILHHEYIQKALQFF